MSKNYTFPANEWYYITEYIYVSLGLPDEPPYTWGVESSYKIAWINLFGTVCSFEQLNNQYAYTATSNDFTNNTIKILELENMLIIFDYLIKKRKLLSLFNYDKLMEERELIIKEINELIKNSKLADSEDIENLYPEKTYISSGYSKAKKRYRDAIKRKK